MEQYVLENDIPVFCIKASSFPDGIQAAFEKVHEICPAASGRTYYGVSHGSPDGIIYYAAAESLSGETNPGNCELFVIKKGIYTGRIVNWKEHTNEIGDTFSELISDVRVDPNGACIEKYLGETEVQCMVRLDDTQI